MIATNCELTAEQLRRTFDPETLGISTTAGLKPIEWIIGQARAVSALRFGLDIRDVGFHVYVAGPPGSGKMTALHTFLEQVAKREKPPADWCYVYNFEDPYQPAACQLPAGEARQFQQEMAHVIDYVRRELPKTFEGDEYAARQAEIGKSLDQQRSKLLGRMDERARQAGFALQATSLGLVLLPAVAGRSLNDMEAQSLPAAAREDTDRRRDGLQEEFKASLKQIRELEQAAQEQLQILDRQAVEYVVSGLIEDLGEKYRAIPQVVGYLRAVKQDILEHIEPFKHPRADGPVAGSPGFVDGSLSAQELAFRKYAVNVIVDNGKQSGAPVIFELNPVHNNLFGRVEKEPQFGSMYTDFTMVRAGSLHRANGGYLVLSVEAILRDPVSWEGLKRALRSGQIHVEEIGERMGFPAIKSLRPAPIPLNIKILLVGPPALYYTLYAQDEDFPELFKVKADFDTRMDCNDDAVRDFLGFLCALCCKEGLRHMDRGAVAKILEHALRLAEDQTKLSTEFGMIADVVREANFWARQEEAPLVTASHVRRAVQEKLSRASLIQERVQEMISRGMLVIDTAGDAVGQVNGLSVMKLGDSLFGRPTRITATVGLGREGIIDIEREVRLGGPLHSKGILIVSGYLAQQYASRKPLTLAARLVFEQSYEGVDGDSASCAELYALLSALSAIPIKQGIAVTGSVNQHGHVQAIGGINEKIEGFFDVCKAKGLNGEQGVLIPSSNMAHLMVREDVASAVKAHQFYIWAVKTIDEGIEILTGTPAGARDSEGHFPSGTLNERVDRRLRDFAERLKSFQAVSFSETKEQE
jgi:predicted ATP-dependent protease